MPCYTSEVVEQNEYKWKQDRAEIVIKNLQTNNSIPYGYRVNFYNGTLSITGADAETRQQIREKVVQGYSAQVLREASAKFGFVVKKQSVTTNGLTKLTIGAR